VTHAASSDATSLRASRRLTRSALARLHERRMAQNGGARPIPWHLFDRARYSPAALDLAIDATRALARGEYAAVALFGAVSSALALNACPFDLVSAAARIPADEIRHAEYATRMMALLSGQELSKASIEVRQAALLKECVRPSTLSDLDIFMLELPAISESIATALLFECHQTARDPVLRAFYRNIVRDEVHHARLGWYYLAWRAPQWTAEERQRVADRAGEIVVQIEDKFSTGRDAPGPDASDARALGVLDTASQKVAISRLMESEMVPALDRLGLGASRAWRVRRRFRAVSVRVHANR
jgi:hypothetical protein